jgi:hypothetical protein
MGGSRRVLDRLELAWSRAELGTSLAVVTLLVGSLLAWVALKGLSSRTTDTFIAGFVFRALSSAAVVGALVHRLGRGSRLAWPAALLAAAAAWPWRDAGTDYFANLLGWLQDGSLLTWFGGLRGLGTRLTLWLALLGASLATASGRHVTIDLLTRALGEAARRPFGAQEDRPGDPTVARRARPKRGGHANDEHRSCAGGPSEERRREPARRSERIARRSRLGHLFGALGGVVAAIVCFAAAWGFFDFSAVDAFGASPRASALEKASAVATGLGRHLDFAARQGRIDLAMASKVLRGLPWSRTLTGAEWNDLLGAAPELQAQRELDPGALRSPLLSRPEEASRGLLVKDFNLIVPFGLVMIALRFLLWLARGAPVESAHGPAEGA